jgi:uncharacterized protein (DUF433 family)
MAAKERVGPADKRVLGRYVVADPAVCHGQLTFRGTRIFVADVLEQVASGMAWESIVVSWRGAVSEAAIAEAVRLAREALLAHHHELAAE